MIYLASPYSHSDPAVMTHRFTQAAQAAARLMLSGHSVFSPIAHTHPILVEGGLPRGWDFWMRYDHWFISRCDEVCVLMLDGWDHSKGVSAEMDMAKRLGKPVIAIRLGRECDDYVHRKACIPSPDPLRYR